MVVDRTISLQTEAPASFRVFSAQRCRDRLRMATSNCGGLFLATKTFVNPKRDFRHFQSAILPQHSGCSSRSRESVSSLKEGEAILPADEVIFVSLRTQPETRACYSISLSNPKFGG